MSSRLPSAAFVCPGGKKLNRPLELQNETRFFLVVLIDTRQRRVYTVLQGSLEKSGKGGDIEEGTGSPGNFPGMLDTYCRLQQQPNNFRHTTHHSLCEQLRNHYSGGNRSIFHSPGHVQTGHHHSGDHRARSNDSDKIRRHNTGN
jgi:hypothetical protein